jgi:hypothetical protein
MLKMNFVIEKSDVTFLVMPRLLPSLPEASRPATTLTLA